MCVCVCVCVCVRCVYVCVCGCMCMWVGVGGCGRGWVSGWVWGTFVHFRPLLKLLGSALKLYYTADAYVLQWAVLVII